MKYEKLLFHFSRCSCSRKKLGVNLLPGGNCSCVLHKYLGIQCECYHQLLFLSSCCCDCSAEPGAHYILGRSCLFLHTRTFLPCSYRNCYILAARTGLASMEEHLYNTICSISSTYRKLCQCTRNNK